MDRISREIAFVPLGGRIRSKRSSCMKFFFFYFGMSTRHAYLKLRKYGDSSHVFQRTKRSGSWLMFLEDGGIFFFFFGLWLMFSENQRFWILAHVFRRLRIFGRWLMFSKNQRFWILTHIFRGPRIFWDLAHVFRGLRVLRH